MCGEPPSPATSQRRVPRPAGRPQSRHEGRAVSPRARPRLVVLDYGSGNLRSAERALQRAGADVTVTADSDAALNCDGLVVPGVGAFAAWVEHGTATAGCGELPGVVERLTAPVLPHMGWNTVRPPAGTRLLAGLDPGTRFYFVHSYAARSLPPRAGRSEERRVGNECRSAGRPRGNC